MRKTMHVIRALAALCVSLLPSGGVVAQDFGFTWIAHPAADDTSQIWFRQTYSDDDAPVLAKITVATCGYVDVYVNERNVTGDVLVPTRGTGTAIPIAVTYDVTRFVRPDTNTIAVWYSPTYAHIDSCQLALNFYGLCSDGSPFAHSTDKGWLCRVANRRLNADGQETVDATECERFKWYGDKIAVALWVPAEERPHGCGPIERRQPPYEAERVERIRHQAYFTVTGNSVVYDFREAFRGFVRVTLRGAKKGERINIGGMEYTCRGVNDEQVFGKFAPMWVRRILISGDDNFSPKQIQSVEAMETATYTHTSIY